MQQTVKLFDQFIGAAGHEQWQDDAKRYRPGAEVGGLTQYFSNSARATAPRLSAIGMHLRIDEPLDQKARVVRIIDHDVRHDAATDCDVLYINAARLDRLRWKQRVEARVIANLGNADGGNMMTKMLIPVVAVSLLVVTASACYARGGTSAFAPGTSFHAMGSIAGHPGASGYAPGHLRRARGSLLGHPGASGFAPGHRFTHHMTFAHRLR